MWSSLFICKVLIFTALPVTSAWLVPHCFSCSMCSVGCSQSPAPARTLFFVYCLKIAVLKPLSSLSATGECGSSQLLSKQRRAWPKSALPLGSLSRQALFLLGKKELLLTFKTLTPHPRLGKAASPEAKNSCYVWRRACLIGPYRTVWAAKPSCCRRSRPLQKEDSSCPAFPCFSASPFPNYVLQKRMSLQCLRQLCKGHTNIFFPMGKLRQQSCNCKGFCGRTGIKSCLR